MTKDDKNGGNDKGRQKWRDAPLTKKAPYKPDAGNLHVRFDERDVETSHGRTTKAPPDERGGNSYVRSTATASHLDSTHPGRQDRRQRRRLSGVNPPRGRMDRPNKP